MNENDVDVPSVVESAGWGLAEWGTFTSEIVAPIAGLILLFFGAKQLRNWSFAKKLELESEILDLVHRAMTYHQENLLNPTFNRFGGYDSLATPFLYNRAEVNALNAILERFSAFISKENHSLQELRRELITFRRLAVTQTQWAARTRSAQVRAPQARAPDSGTSENEPPVS